MSRVSLLLFVLTTLLWCNTEPAQAQSAIVSTMRNVNAVTESRGYYLAPANDRSGGTSGSLAPIQAFEIMRPNQNAVTIGRLYTSCTCVQLSSFKQTFSKGERAVLELKNVHPTPVAGQRYAIYVQLTSPVRVTLRYDTYVQSSQFVITEPKVVEEPVAAEKESLLDNAAEKAKDAAEAAADLAEPAVDAIKDAGSAAGAAIVDGAVAVGEKASELASAAADAVSGDGDAGKEEAAAVTESESDKPAASPATAIEVVDQRISLITLGVSDMTRSREFYESLGWKIVPQNKYSGIAFFQLTNGMVLSLYPNTELARDQKLATSPAPSGAITLGINVRNKEDVQSTYQKFIDAGGKSVKAPEERPWGAVTGYVADPDGHTWEISWIPQMQLDSSGELWIK